MFAATTGKGIQTMDQVTIAAYDRAAASFADDWAAQPEPSDMYGIVREYFTPGPTADVGCGGGRDTAWLNGAGFAARGFDASDKLLAEARARFPDLRFDHAVLPALTGVADDSFANVLCETVIMHLEPPLITSAVERLMAILRPGGTLYLSWRVTEAADRRDEFGRLYAAFDPALVLRPLASAEILLDEQVDSVSSGKVIRRIVARKAASLAQDR
jgi:SAM-dependent methyltransferase